jgi:hypothetical protein
MGRAGSAHGGEVRCILDFVGETSGKETYWETQVKWDVGVWTG